MPPQVLSKYWPCTIKNVLTGCITACTVQQKGAGSKSGRSILKMEGAATPTVITSTSSIAENFYTSTLAYDRHFFRTASGLLDFAEIVIGLLVWMLIAGTNYFRVSAFGWVMFVAILYWVLTVIFLIIYLTMAYNRIPQVPWTVVGLFFNSSATVMYVVAAAVDAASISHAVKGRHNYNCWVASTFFAFLVTLCYAGSTYISFQLWRSRDEEQ
ncbi:CKLF-like MARVEL transmembrane domain-containing protein 8 [Coregonus clupeaformis]|uniref:CKLF-like MARVEL transmembrane domain-containing protein 8 n=1 Tax=Coregonus clupeaformis TaxID=59861 RepID=UPI001E1C6203|nr:CKLF-like MARVEL transmembrane domain-containing protein 8 [Coregonus clupeaformis]